METLIWAFGSMVVLMLILLFLPFGFSKKGRLIIVLTASVLALGGTAVLVILPLWETSILLTVLIFFIAYIADNRIGKLLYNENSQIELMYEDEEPIINDGKNSLVHKLDKNEADILLSSNVILESTKTEKPLENNNMELLSETTDDLSYLLSSDGIVLDEDDKLKPISETGDISDIESFLAEEANYEVEMEDDNWLEKLVEAESINADNDGSTEKIEDDNWLDQLVEVDNVTTANDESIEKLEDDNWLDKLVEIEQLSQKEEQMKEKAKLVEDCNMTTKEAAAGKVSDHDETLPLIKK